MTADAYRILLIEDNPGDARLIREMLADEPRTPFAIDCVATLAAALPLLTDTAFAVALTDLGLPDSSGLETLRRLRANCPPTTAIVVLSGLGDEELALRAVREGAQDYLIKGRIDSQLLVRALRYAIERNAIKEALRLAQAGLERQVRERTTALADTVKSLQNEVVERKRAELAIQHSEQLLREKQIALEQKNLNLREVLEQLALEKAALHSNVQTMIDKMLLPTFRLLRRKSTSIEKRYLDILENNLRNITRELHPNLKNILTRLSPRELEICSMIRNGFSCKEIAGVLHLTTGTVQAHRNNIRKKLQLRRKGVNLTVFLRQE